MNVVQTPPVETALRTMGEDDRRKIQVWFDYLRNWEKDGYIRQHSKKLDSYDDVYVLKTSDQFNIFFRLEPERIVLLDIASEATLRLFSQTSGSGQ